ncbi:MAG: tRNA (adenosine(37)-N6)-threonylcarbamoyltransferase complex dimerization subunit type 1 TsaB [Syntrophobacteraceae bacterium]
MRILAVDTSTMSGSLALLDGEDIIAEWTLRSAMTHNRRLMKSVDFLLREAGWELDALGGIAVASGPGSFTGLRIGMTTMKVLAWTTAKLYAGIPTLDALSFPLSFSSYPVCSMIDARKGEVYCALYRPDGNGTLRLAMPYMAVSPGTLAEKIVEPVIFCGDGWAIHKNLIKRRIGSLALEAPASFHIIRAASVAELARRRFIRGDSDNPVSSRPLYVRPSEAEIHYPHLAKKSSGKPEII